MLYPEKKDMAISINSWKEKLLDLGKRNRMINFKDSSLGSLEVVIPSAETVFGRTAGDMRPTEIFDSDKFFKERIAKNEDKISRKEFVDSLSGKIGNSQIALFGESGQMNKVIKRLHKISNEALVERGNNILYLAFGFVRWFEQDKRDEVFHAPLILVPVSIKIESAALPVKLVLYEDQILTNPTFTYKLRTEFGIQLPQYGDEKYETGKLNGYFSKVSGCIEKMGWTVSDDVKLSTFLFMKMDMYIDLKENEEFIMQNPNVRKLAGYYERADHPDASAESGKKAQTEMTPDAQGELRNVVDADSSQTEAIRMAKSGYSFVLQGPPGTGKSQTITNIISECLADGKKILFVSEKLAALKVVQNNLRNAGLDDFCLELHGQKMNKKEVLTELNRVLELGRTSVTEKAARELEALYASKKELDAYADALHRKNDAVGMSPYELYGESYRYRNYEDLDAVIPSIESKGPDYLNEADVKLSAYAEYTKTVGKDHKKNSWYGYVSRDTSFEHKRELKKRLEGITGDIGSVCEAASEIKSACSIELITLRQAKALGTVMATAAELGPDSPSLYGSDLNDVIRVFTLLKERSDEIIAVRTEIDGTFKGSVYELDCDGILDRFRTEYKGLLKGLNKNYKADRERMTDALKNPKQTLTDDMITETLSKLKGIKEITKKMSDEGKQYTGILGTSYLAERTDWNRILPLLSDAKNALLCVDGLAAVLKNGIPQTLKGPAGRIAASVKAADAHMQFLSTVFDSSVCGTDDTELSAVLRRFRNCLDDLDTVDNWVGFRKLYTELMRTGLSDIVDKAAESNIAPDRLAGAFKKLYIRQWISYILNNDPLLSVSERIEHDRNVRSFADKDRLQFRINRAFIVSKLSEMRPNPDPKLAAEGGDVSVLKREARKQRQQMPVRLLLKEIPKLVQTLKPCFLMSPLSVSTLLDPKFSFDTVIFDEASQIYPEDAIGAIYRAKQTIVVGDSRQMPPSNFFSVTSADETYSDDEYSDDADAFESILDISDASYARKYLQWHYRSKTEDLIAFSNKNFYENRLVTFPSVRRRDPDNGVDLHYLSDGTYSNNTNRHEAEYIADMVFRHFETYPERSLGIVAFSQKQQDLIDDTITKRREKDISMERFFRDEVKEPFFVKNLETVQGDERDTIIFSVGYAKNQSGVLVHNFGPLNKKGGERRLNVAVTRAKCNVKLVSSIKSTDIDLSRSAAEGTRLLKEYLYYAEHGVPSAHTAGGGDGSESDFEKEVCGFLRENGYSVDMCVGCSGKRIDLAVKDKGGEDYVIAVECDGPVYRSGSSTRDRDRLRQEVLERLGWKYYRIWSTDWFKNNRTEKQRLISFIEETLQKKRTEKDIPPNTGSNSGPGNGPGTVPSTGPNGGPGTAGAGSSPADTTAARNEGKAAVQGQNVTATRASEAPAAAKQAAGTPAAPKQSATAQTAAMNAAAPSAAPATNRAATAPASAPAAQNDKGPEDDDDFLVKGAEDLPFKKYIKADDAKLLEQYNKHRSIQKLAYDLIRAESPISHEWLMKRIAPAYGRKTVTDAIRESFSRDMTGNTFAVLRFGFWYIRDQTTFEFRINSGREINHICVEELSAGVYELVKYNTKVTVNGLIRALADLSGFSRVGDAIKGRMQMVLMYTEKQGRITIDGDNVTLR